MKSLDERIAYRERQQAEAKEANRTAHLQSAPTPESKSDAQKYLSANAESVMKGLKNKTVEELEALAEAEAAGKNRDSVNSAIKTEIDRKKAAASGWGAKTV